ncbi:Binding-protein-dependent transport system inner membrane component [Bibersteinia trehalosi USDA-ARS-USMARC-188]|uniref:Binding-protein-dependent transport system inner membrane component n=4 Tax=Bibersteinia trehalosi TaxID=47735 RepID=W0R813_BIBTR|nr:ABC transporter permease subunit [Bibersteinia trehalosi]AGH38458.1 Binding-protein-dependent transport system inner membrane component [Bibersteinia trehalosi USDA-ARS-USMARC-192]AHG81742.1 Binding-protein-dependent transport system inner membrane component [Bibersteinia trehalosi USDA-ARS-USMARC-188]AHG84028.1 Binding-protein-dependent transport system inner membrane component [Bibersteinia trehalosi USDA-ARS-USMARC-189]AHG86445.1 Binding-protein-dependent transport system inner membrane c
MLNNQEPEQFRQQDYFRQFWQQLRKDRLALISLVLFIALLILVFAGYLLAPYSSDQQFVGFELMPPSWSNEGQISHFFGTDNLGRDVFSRILYGFYYTVGSALLISASVAIIGGIIGILTGIQKGSPILLLSHLFDTFLFTPVLLIAIIIATLMTPNLINAMLAVFLALLPHFIHRIYQTTRRELKREYVVTLILDGADKWTLIKKVVLPNVSIVAIKELCQIFTIAVIDISALSFISLGAESQTAEWGAMIRDAIDLIYIAPWTVVLPGLAIVFSVLIIALLGNSIVRVLRQYRH